MARLALDSLEGSPEMPQSEREGLGRAGGLSKTRAGWAGGSRWCAVGGSCKGNQRLLAL